MLYPRGQWRRGCCHVSDAPWNTGTLEKTPPPISFHGSSMAAVVPPDNRAFGQTGHIGDHNNIADMLTALQAQIAGLTPPSPVTTGQALLTPSGDVTGATDPANINAAYSAGFNDLALLTSSPWYQNATVQVPPYCTLRSVSIDSQDHGAYLLQVNNANLDAMIASTGWASSTNTTSTGPSVIRGIQLDANKANQGSGLGHGIVLQTFRGRVIDCFVNNTLGDGIRFDAFGRNGSTAISNTAVENRVVRCAVRNPGGIGISTTDTVATGAKLTDGFITDCLVSGAGGHAIKVGQAAGWRLAGNHCYSNSQSGIVAGRSYMTRITDNYVETWGSTAALGTYAAIDAGTTPSADGGDGSVIHGNTCRFVSGPGNAGSTIYGIFFQASNGSNGNVTIGSNMMFASAGGGTAIAIALKNQNNAATITYGTDGGNVIVGAGWTSSAITLIANGGTIINGGV